jgi:hypothetical protein
MQISTPTAHAATPAPSIAPPSDSTAADSASWKNPAAAAALQTSVNILQQIEDGIVKHYGDVERVRTFASDLHQSSDMFAAASDAVTSDASADNDQFVPLLGRASDGVSSAETRISSKDLSSTWPSERSDILSTIRTAKLIATNVSRQLDPIEQPPAARA